MSTADTATADTGVAPGHHDHDEHFGSATGGKAGARTTLIRSYCKGKSCTD